ncbi:MAG: hypothetical protein COW73_00700, partial [Nitrospirae bacterium CG18_big_fil_WC_8_21_14_2_50_70_55]
MEAAADLVVEAAVGHRGQIDFQRRQRARRGSVNAARGTVQQQGEQGFVGELGRGAEAALQFVVAFEQRGGRFGGEFRLEFRRPGRNRHRRRHRLGD